jgi:lysophospholipase L1-like esterase
MHGLNALKPHLHRLKAHTAIPVLPTLSTTMSVTLENARILLVGSSIMELWENAGEMLAPSSVTNLGASGSVTKDWLPTRQGRGLIETRVLPLLSPENHSDVIVVFYCGSNDINNGLKADEIWSSTKTIFSFIWQTSPKCTILYLEVMAAPQKIKDGLIPVVYYLNGIIKAEVEAMGNEGRVLYVPVNDLLSDRCYLQDQLHLTSEGYLHVADRIKESLTKASRP